MRKRLIIISALIICTSAGLLQIQKIGDKKATVLYNGYLGSDSGTITAIRDPTGVPPSKRYKGMLIVDGSNALWCYNGSTWVNVGGSGVPPLQQVLDAGNSASGDGIILMDAGVGNVVMNTTSGWQSYFNAQFTLPRIGFYNSVYNGYFEPPAVMSAERKWKLQNKSYTLADSAVVAGIISGQSYLPPYIDVGNNYVNGQYIYVDTASDVITIGRQPARATHPGVTMSATNMFFYAPGGQLVYTCNTNVWSTTAGVNVLDMDNRAGYASNGTTKLFDFVSAFKLYSLGNAATGDSILTIHNNTISKMAAPVFANLTTTGTGAALSFTFTIASGYTFANFQSQNAATPAVIMSNISGTTLTITCASAPILSAAVSFGGFYK